ncbi:hypothetical protein CDAR_199901 [Caerostris darwini]|uniref:Uncharacterized protein n=1 Tax=Caerostris darwini TaxID=1538125 RepID=A0AAV4QXS4_9ARAC|nr:hypothetical protein CDAR_199901 [Caerostris darwini]
MEVSSPTRVFSLRIPVIPFSEREKYAQLVNDAKYTLSSGVTSGPQTGSCNDAKNAGLVKKRGHSSSVQESIDAEIFRSHLEEPRPRLPATDSKAAAASQNKCPPASLPQNMGFAFFSPADRRIHKSAWNNILFAVSRQGSCDFILE